MDKELLLRLNREKKYEEIYKIFYNEYLILLKNFFMKKGYEYEEDRQLSYYVELLNIYDETGKYDNVISIFTDIFIIENFTCYENIINAIDFYNYVFKKLT